MDEILIDEKKYISSKQAAKITGYAKDYIGQLCREGRVPARLVGRSWYVLESAIQDHRFAGDPSDKPVAAAWAAEPPHYEAVPEASEPMLPVIKRIRSKEIELPKEDNEPQEAPESLQDSWKAWFDRVGDAIASVAVPEPEKEHLEAVQSPEPEVEPTIQEDVEEIYEPEEVSVPIHSIYKAPPRDIMPRYLSESEPVEEDLREEVKVQPAESVSISRKGKRSFGTKALQALVILIAIAAVSLAVIGSGYLDSFIVSIQQVNTVSGVSIYNK